MQSLRNILSLLADGRFHSGTALASRLGISRTAVWKQIQRLSEQYNIPVQAVQGRGYRLPAPLELLDADTIIAELSPTARASLGRLQIEWSLESTSQWLMQSSDVPCGTVVVAEHQSRGRGRRGREWVSPFAANLTFSLLGCFQGAPANLAGLSLAVAVSVVRALSALGVEGLGLKWPNDIQWQGKKLCGILLEMQGEAGGPCRLVCGIGLNVSMPQGVAQDIEQPWTDLQRIMGRPPSRHQLLTALLDELMPALPRYEQEGLQPFLSDWRRWDAVAGKSVQLFLPQRTVHGRAIGIDAQGNLLIEHAGRQETYCSGEISLRTEMEQDHAITD
ncbi:MAG: bifunctional biotin--[acetyl-CoA-carboxylase] ligase/biotin operon repressor BirA [Thiohalophilus sp.]|uniref:bifunctional biotin--[acetyl-CoA-carboxylase] ligase/biotin operon repressor BirA n=1 Tax=Thiohalophilus sp. TaxID=3028392 RepID=UPI00287034A5|nr:bifunctional biotin--[acetyl-CoA-carboxylase] ligase/biotin operon repressor BirA [Thiohalophilus sp.]MDR9437567.1 bifunctional biotin--[acetyl-CoA-carboxylase] ligase/biotin operon repressor BirA [Thiohalophilus sp.]